MLTFNFRDQHDSIIGQLHEKKKTASNSFRNGLLLTMLLKNWVQIENLATFGFWTKSVWFGSNWWKYNKFQFGFDLVNCRPNKSERSIFVSFLPDERHNSHTVFLIFNTCRIYVVSLQYFNVIYHFFFFWSIWFKLNLIEFGFVSILFTW